MILVKVVEYFLGHIITDSAKVHKIVNSSFFEHILSYMFAPSTKYNSNVGLSL